MNEYMILVVILLPIIGGVMIPLFKFKKREHTYILTELIVVINSILVFALLLNRPEEAVTLIRFTGNLYISFQIDGLSVVFSGLIAFLWPLASLYAFEYMKKEKHEKMFYMFYTVTYGVTLGIAMAGNIITMYFFYELLTLVTVPLVMHTLSREAILASRKYLYYSLGGAAFAFIGVIMIITYTSGGNFVMGGTMGYSVSSESMRNVLLVVYVLTFLGFGVKAAICPFNSWLPQAGVAPTPVTALLHAVAVVKSGAFAIMRITFYCYNPDDIRGTWAQNLLMIIVIITIIYGCSMALKETHLKRRLAYSTISNLSYILFGVVIMTPLGLIGALSHMVFHAFIKITSFFCAGSIIHQTGKQYIYELNGLGRKMPIVFTVFCISGLALMGVPGLAGFISKWNLAAAAVDSQNPLAYIGIGAILISALLTAIYMMTIVVRAFILKSDEDQIILKDKEGQTDLSGKKEQVAIKDPNWMMLLPLGIFVVVIIYFGLHPQPLIELFEVVAGISTQGGL